MTDILSDTLRSVTALYAAHGLSYDGSRRMVVSRWDNPCGHIDKYGDVRIEARTNGLNEVRPGYERAAAAAREDGLRLTGGGK